MKNSYSENGDENFLKELENIKLKSFKELEHQYFKDNLDDFQKKHLKEFQDVELKEFKEFIEDSKADRSIENIRLELNSKDVLNKIIKELQDMGINGKLHLKLLRMLKRFP